MSSIVIGRAGPLVTIQDRGRFGALRHGISASGPMDSSAFAQAGAMLRTAGTSAIEFTQAGVAFVVEGAPIDAAFVGGDFTLTVNRLPHRWPARLELEPGDAVDITPGPAGNYGYVRFGEEIDVPPVLGSRATNTVAGLGGYGGRALKIGDWLTTIPVQPASRPASPRTSERPDQPIRVVWGIHADLFDPQVRLAFTGAPFEVSARMDRMGVRLAAPPEAALEGLHLSLVSDAIVPGDIQILGDGTPIVLMRDHQPTGGYPRIATVISADLDRFAQMRPGTIVTFDPVTPKRAQALLR